MEEPTSEEARLVIPDLTRIKAETAAEICEKCALRDEALEMLEEEMTPADFLAVLIENEFYSDGIKFLAQALPKKQAVLWAHACAAEASGESPNELDAKCLAMAEAWLESPSEENRRAAMDAADEAGYSTPAASAAAAAGWTAGSMGPAEYDDVPPPENLTGTTAATAVLLASLAGKPEETKPAQRRFVESGIEIGQKPSRE
jgi:hypothetical protein